MAIICSENFSDLGAGVSINGRTLNNGLGGSASKAWTSTGFLGIPSVGGGVRGYPAVSRALISESTQDLRCKTAFIFRSSPNQAAVFGRCAAEAKGPGVAALIVGPSSFRIRSLTNGDTGGTDVATKSITALAADTLYWLELGLDGDDALANVYAADGTTLIDTLSHTFSGGAPTNTGWGFGIYNGGDADFDNFTLATLDDPPSGGGLLNILMQHGQFNGGLL